jgi:hypothetical protein
MTVNADRPWSATQSYHSPSLMVWHGCNSLKRKAPRPKPFSGGAWNDPGCERTVDEACATPNREGAMSFIFMIMAVPFLSATGLYNPQVMHHGHCIAEPGSFDALYCSASAEAAPHYRKYRAR